MMKNKLNIKNKLLLAFIMISIMPIFIISFLALKFEEHTIIDLYLNQANIIATSTVKDLENYINDIIRKFKIQQYNPKIIDNLAVLEKFIANKSAKEYQKAKSELDNILQTTQRTENLTDVFLAGTNGIIYYNANYSTSWEYLGKSLSSIGAGSIPTLGINDVYVSSIYRDPINNTYSILISLPIIDANNHYYGAIAIKAPIIDDLYRILAAYEQISGQTTELILGKLTKAGILAASPLHFDYASINRVLINKEPLKKNNQQNYMVGTDYLGKEAIFIIKNIPLLKLVFVIKKDKSEVFYPVEKFSRLLYLATAIVMVLSIILAIQLAITMTRPLLNLAASVTNTDVKKIIVDISQKLLSREDEIGTLAKVIYAKGKQVDDYFKELSTVQKSLITKANELSKINNDLEIAQKIARLGYWLYDKKLDKIIWKEKSNTIEKLLEKKPQHFSDMIALIHPEDQDNFKKMIAASFLDGKNHECEMRLKDISENYHWFYIIFHPHAYISPTEKMTIVMMDITQRKEAENELKALHQKLLVVARQAGMSEVATSVLHNVGNVLNSAKVSVQVLQEQSNKSNFKNLVLVTNKIKENITNLPQFISVDPKGKIIPEYLIKLIPVLEKENSVLLENLSMLAKAIKHIESIIAMQQSLSGVSGITEKTLISESINTAIQMCNDAIIKRNIQLKKFLETGIFINTDQAKLMQILVNLIKNSVEALSDEMSLKRERILSIKTEKILSNQVKITIADNGSGISRENLTKIFSMGFTTKSNGHGFGLHSCCLLAKELDGELSVASEGPGMGATFTLILPCQDKAVHLSGATTYDNVH